ncbi:MAG: mechanosensitive ion channel [Planctomycetes bacterium]|nr:mechanosensitive ion channel [Planctomycetota bacterium]
MIRFLSWTTCILVMLVAPVVLTFAQDDQPADNDTTEQPEPVPEPKVLPPLPTAPFVKEDVEALEAHVESTQEALNKARTNLTEKKAAAAEAGLSVEDQAARDEEVKQAEDSVKSVEALLKPLQDAVTAAKAGPTRAQLDARRRYDSLVATAEQVRKDLTLGREKIDENTTAIPEGDYAKAVRLAEEEQARTDQLADNAKEFEFQKSRVYDKLSDLEKLDYEMRWASERFQLSIEAYNHMSEKLFGAYKSYEQRAFEGLKAIEEAIALWPEFKGTPAQQLELPEKAVAPSTLSDDNDITSDVKSDIEYLLASRISKSSSQKLRIREYAGELQKLQQEIDNREDYKERLEQDAERLKNVLAESGDKPAAEPDENAIPESELEDYQKLSIDIDDYKQAIKDNKVEIDRLAKERIELQKLVAAKQQVEAEVIALTEETQARIDAIEVQFEKPDPKAKPEDKPAEETGPKVEVPQYYQRPAVVIFALREQLKAEQERLSSAKRDTRQAMTQLDILDRRVERLTEKNTEIESVLLPETRKNYYEEIGKTVGIRAAKVAGVLLAAWILLFLIRKIGEPLIERIVNRADSKSDFSADEQQRARTLMTVFMTTARVVVYITAIMFAIAQFDVDYGPLLVAAGGVSLAVGFGAQTLVKDFFAGFFILLEGQFSIGDVVDVGGKVGTVENLNLRTTVLRSLNGDVHTIPNGEISSTTNMTKLWSRAIVDIGVAYEENTDDVGAVMEGVAKEMREDEAWSRKLLDTILMGVTELGDSAVTIRMLLKTRAGEQWGASREYLRRCKLKFDELGIEIPWPQTVMSYKGYADQDDKTQAAEQRKKRAQVLRYVRKMRGEMTEEEATLASMSVEERDRAESLANREAELAKEKAKTSDATPQEVAAERKENAADDATLSDAEKLAKRLATKQISKDQAEARTNDPMRQAPESDSDGEGEGDGK